MVHANSVLTTMSNSPLHRSGNPNETQLPTDNGYYYRNCQNHHDHYNQFTGDGWIAKFLPIKIETYVLELFQNDF